MAAAGPLSNFLVAAVLAGVLQILPLRAILASGGAAAGWTEFLVRVLIATIGINVLLGVFNLLPIPPLDGYRVALRILPKGPHGVLPAGRAVWSADADGTVRSPFFTQGRLNPVGDVISPVSRGITRLLGL